MYFIYGYICFELDVASDFIIREMRRNEKFPPFACPISKKLQKQMTYYMFSIPLYI